MQLIEASDLPEHAELAPRNQLPKVSVTNVVIDDDSISFTVDRIGVPVSVKVGFFPNWRVSGADEIYRATPNFMVVVPTSHNVVLRYKDTSVEYAGYAMTGLGIAILVLLGRFGKVNFDRPIRRVDTAPEPDDDTTADVEQG